MSRQSSMSIIYFVLFVCIFLCFSLRNIEAQTHVIGVTPVSNNSNTGSIATGPSVNTASTTAWIPDPEITAMLASNPNLLDRQIELAMRSVLKDPATLSITIISKDPNARSRGFLDQVIVKQQRGSIDNLVLDYANIEFYGVQLDTTKLVRETKIETVNVKNINMDVIIRENDLNAFLAVKAKKIKVDNPKIELHPGYMELEGSTRYSFMKVKFWATGGFEVVDSREIWFHARKLKMNNLSMPRAFIGSIVKRINPVLNLEKFPFRLNLKEIRIEKGALHFTSFRQGG